MDRKTLSKGFMFLLTMGGTLAAGLGQAPESLASDPTPVAMAGKVVSVEGRVLIRQDGASQKTANLKAGDQIREGDVINTSSNGKVKLLLEDKTILDLGASALFKVQKFEVNHGGDRQVDLQMSYGTVRASVSRPIAAGGKFQIRTKTATMGVRGTEFIVQSQLGALTPQEKKAERAESAGKPQAAPDTKITVVQGKVEVTAKPVVAETLKGDSRKPSSAPKVQAPVMLTAGTQLTASATAPMTQPITIKPAELGAMTAAVKMTDNTFSKAITLDMHSDSGSGDSSAGAATRAALAVAIAAPMTAPLPSGNSGFIGTFSPMNALNRSPAMVQPGGLKNIHIVVTQ